MDLPGNNEQSDLSSETVDSDNDSHPELEFSNTPNFLTLARIVCVPIIIGLLYFRTPNGDIAATVVFVLASITDYFDGYIARLQKLETVYGKLLDPLADKFLVVSVLIMLQELGRVHPVIVILLICREIAITGLRALASAEGVIIPASESAKWKTATQMVAIPFLMVFDGKSENAIRQGGNLLGTILIYTSLLISLWSAKDYLVGFFKGVKEKARARVLRRKQLRKEMKAGF